MLFELGWMGVKERGCRRLSDPAAEGWWQAASCREGGGDHGFCGQEQEGRKNENKKKNVADRKTTCKECQSTAWSSEPLRPMDEEWHKVSLSASMPSGVIK